MLNIDPLTQERVVFIWASRGAEAFREWFPELMDCARKADFVTLALFDTSSGGETERRARPSKRSKQALQIRPLLREALQEQEQLRASLAPISEDATRDHTETGEGQVESSERASLGHMTGRPSLNRIIRTKDDREEAAVLACGPPGLTLAAQAVAHAQRMDFHRESFLW